MDGGKSWQTLFFNGMDLGGVLTPLFFGSTSIFLYIFLRGEFFSTSVLCHSYGIFSCTNLNGLGLGSSPRAFARPPKASPPYVWCCWMVGALILCLGFLMARYQDIYSVGIYMYRENVDMKKYIGYTELIGEGWFGQDTIHFNLLEDCIFARCDQNSWHCQIYCKYNLSSPPNDSDHEYFWNITIIITIVVKVIPFTFDIFDPKTPPNLPK